MTLKRRSKALREATQTSNHSSELTASRRAITSFNVFNPHPPPRAFPLAAAHLVLVRCCAKLLPRYFFLGSPPSVFLQGLVTPISPVGTAGLRCLRCSGLGDVDRASTSYSFRTWHLRRAVIWLVYCDVVLAFPAGFVGRGDGSARRKLLCGLAYRNVPFLWPRIGLFGGRSVFGDTADVRDTGSRLLAESSGDAHKYSAIDCLCARENAADPAYRGTPHLTTRWS